jgi:PAS domain S-box-containing protein
VTLDITERKAAEEALFQEKERAQITLASIGEGMITTDAAGRVESLNAAAEQLLGRSEKEAQGLALSQVFHTVDAITRRPRRIQCRNVCGGAKSPVLATRSP